MNDSNLRWSVVGHSGTKYSMTDIICSVRWYWRYFSPNVDREEKEELLDQLLGYDWSFDGTPPEDDAPLSEFPGLKKRWYRDSITNTEMLFVTGELYMEMKEDG